ncbi:MAG: carbohydrate kinase family protein, partial [Lachnospiraceae bacterium]|nr:carbohydrate kinase family protein [Lachnospiraceae bacterium]
MSIVVIGTVFVDVKGFPEDIYIPDGRNAGRVEYVHGGVARNVVEDIANMELRPTFVSMVDNTPMGSSVLEKLKNHKVNTDYVLTTPDGMGTWLAVFDEKGDVAGSISQRPNAYPLVGLLEEKGDEIFSKAESVVLQLDLHKDIVKKVFDLAQKYDTKLYALVSNMT